MLFALRVKLTVVHGLERHYDDIGYGSVHQAEEVNLALKFRRGLLEAERVTLLQFPVIGFMLLHSIIRQVNKRLIYTLLCKCEFLRAHSNVALAEQIAPLVCQVCLIDKYPEAYVELAAVN